MKIAADKRYRSTKEIFGTIQSVVCLLGYGACVDKLSKTEKHIQLQKAID